MLQSISAEAPRLLILAADQRPVRPLADGLARDGVVVHLTPEPEALLRRAAAEAPDAVLLLTPLQAPHGAGEAFRRLRGVMRIPCVLLATPEDGPEDRAAALDAGADEVLHCGIPLPEAIARIRAVLRRARPRGGWSDPAGWRLVESGRRLVPPAGEPMRLTGAEYALLDLLIAADGRPADRETVSRVVFRRPWNPEDRAVDSLVKRLRPKLPDGAIQSARGIGYALTLPIRPIRLRV